MKINENELCLLINENFYSGLTIKNYNELCSILNLSNMGGNTKITNLKNIKRYCDLEKKGHKYIINEVYKTPKEKEDKRQDINNSIYVKLIESILLNEFISASHRVLYYTNIQLWESLGMVNSSYKMHNYNNKLLFNEIQKIDNRVKKWHVNKAYEKSRKKLIEITKSALHSLSRRELISYNEDIFMARKNGEYFEVTDFAEIETILQCRKETLNELNCKEFRDVIYNKNKNININKYYEILNTKLYNRLGYEYVFKSYRIICNRKYLKQGLKDNVKELKKSLNSTIVNKLIDKTYKDYEKNLNDLQEGKTTFKYGENYIDIQKLILTKILCIDEKHIEEFIKNLQLDNEIMGIAFSSEW